MWDRRKQDTSRMHRRTCPFEIVRTFIFNCSLSPLLDCCQSLLYVIFNLFYFIFGRSVSITEIWYQCNIRERSSTRSHLHTVFCSFVEIFVVVVLLCMSNRRFQSRVRLQAQNVIATNPKREFPFLICFSWFIVMLTTHYNKVIVLVRSFQAHGC